MKKFALAAITLLFATQGFSQISTEDSLANKSKSLNYKDTVAWIHNGSISFGVNEGALHNWPAGGEIASLTLNGIFDGSLVHFNHRKVWANNLSAVYGLFYAYSNDFHPRKTDDRIDLTSTYGYRLTEKSDFFLSGLFDAQTQFTKGYNYNDENWQENPTSNFFSPLYITIAPGIEYRHQDMISVFFSPASFRGTFVSRRYTDLYPEGAFGVKHGKTFRAELGAYISARFKKNFSKHVAFRTRLDLYSNYLAKDTRDINGNIIKKDNPGNIDILWDNYLTLNVARFFAVNIGLTAIYDNDVPFHPTEETVNGGTTIKKEPFNSLGWWQIKQLLSIGFNYKF